ncbi:MAG: site-specific integrase [Desulfovibrio desulfuricans]|nr:site-specific integrase [Desulfovibrio desulfuricans]
MRQAKREKSARYPGVYWRVDAAAAEKTYYIRYRLGGRGSKEIEEPVGKSSAGMTEAKASAIRADRMRGKEASNKERRRNLTVQNADAYTLRSAWDVYSEVNSKRSLYQTDRCLLKYFPHLLDRPIKDITTSDIDAIRRKLEKTPSPFKKNGQIVMLAPASIVHVLSLIRRLINFAVKRDLCVFPEHLHFEMPKVDNQKTEVLTDDELARLLKALDEEPNQDAAALIRLALVTGMRKGALLALRWDDCDFDRSIITLRGEAAKKGKTDFIPMTPAARSVLESIENRESDYVFPGKNGGKRADYRRIARRVKQRAGLPEDFRPLHGLRHNYASRLASSGKVELYTLQKLLTHSSPQMTQRYAHLRDETLMRAACLADDMLIKKEKNNE